MPHQLKIALLGGTGAVGGLFLEQALNAGHQVYALARDPDKMAERDGLSIQQGEAANPADVAAIIESADVVVSCIGHTKQGPIMERTAQSILDAARNRTDPPKVVIVSSLGCGGTSLLVKTLSILMGGTKVFADYENADALVLRETAVPYVLVRPTGLTDGPETGKYTAVRSNVTFASRISRADTAKFLLDAATQNTWDGPGGVQLGGFKQPK